MPNRNSAFCVALAVLALAGCATESVWQPPAVSISRIFDSPFEEVWAAARAATAGYPIYRHSEDEGLIETEWMYDGTTMAVREVRPGPGPEDIYRMRLRLEPMGELTRASIRTYHTTFRQDSSFGSPSSGPWASGYTTGYTIYSSDTDEEQRILGAISRALGGEDQ